MEFILIKILTAAAVCQEESIIKKYRSEWKYCEEEAELLALKQRLSAVLPHDSYAGENGKYEIHSLYFDDYKDDCARENVAGEGKRFKYRIRYYGNNSDQLWLEKKEKLNNYCHKRQCPVSAGEYWSIMEGKAMDVFWNTKEQLLKEFCIDI
ncbi:MAG: VTC domain-containing protein, partial [Bacillota bacterium]|nr:VTC domain-containing protein [Bacillota bacterium]